MNGSLPSGAIPLRLARKLAIGNKLQSATAGKTQALQKNNKRYRKDYESIKDDYAKKNSRVDSVAFSGSIYAALL